MTETARLTFEQIDNYFTSGSNVWRTSTGRNKEIAAGEVVDHTHEKGYEVETVEEVQELIALFARLADIRIS